MQNRLDTDVNLFTDCNVLSLKPAAFKLFTLLFAGLYSGQLNCNATTIYNFFKFVGRVNGRGAEQLINDLIEAQLIECETSAAQEGVKEKVIMIAGRVLERITLSNYLQRYGATEVENEKVNARSTQGQPVLTHNESNKNPLEISDETQHETAQNSTVCLAGEIAQRESNIKTNTVGVSLLRPHSGFTELPEQKPKDLTPNGVLNQDLKNTDTGFSEKGKITQTIKPDQRDTINDNEISDARKVNTSSPSLERDENENSALPVLLLKSGEKYSAPLTMAKQWAHDYPVLNLPHEFKQMKIHFELQHEYRKDETEIVTWIENWLTQAMKFKLIALERGEPQEPQRKPVHPKTQHETRVIQPVTQTQSPPQSPPHDPAIQPRQNTNKTTTLQEQDFFSKVQTKALAASTPKQNASPKRDTQTSSQQHTKTKTPLQPQHNANNIDAPSWLLDEQQSKHDRTGSTPQQHTSGVF